MPDTLEDVLTTLNLMNAKLNAIHPSIPDASTSFSAVGATQVAGVTPVVIKAAVATKRHWITEAIIQNTTTAEDQIVEIQDEDDVIAARVYAPNVADAGATLAAKEQTIKFDPPLPIAAGKALEAKATTATGDSWVTLIGYVED